MKQNILILIILSTVLLACEPQTGSEEFLAPKIESAEAVVDGLKASFSCAVSDERAESFGFAYGVRGEEMATVMCELENGVFKTETGWLIPGATYDWYAFVRAGESEVRTETQELHIDETPVIPDPGFRNYLLANYDLDKDGEFTYKEALKIKTLHFCSNDWNVTSLKGIEYMPNLEVLICFGAGEWGTAKQDGTDLTPIYGHYYIGPYGGTWPNCWGPLGTLKYLDVSNNPKLTKLELGGNSALGEELGTLDLSHNLALEYLGLGVTWLEYPDISKNTELTFISLGHLRGTLPDLSGLHKVTELRIDNPQDLYIEKIDLDVSQMPDLEILYVTGKVRSLSDLSANPKLRELAISYTPLENMDLSVCPRLELFDATGCGFDVLNVSANPNLKTLYIPGNNLRSIDLSSNTQLEKVVINNNKLTSLSVSSPKLIHMDCYENELVSLDVTLCNQLEWLSCYKNKLESLDVSNNPNLKLLVCWGNSLVSLDVSKNVNMGHLSCGLNKLTSLDVSNLNKMETLICEVNDIQTLDLSGNYSLEWLNCRNCGLTSLDLSDCTRLQYLDCSKNYLPSLDVSNNLLLGQAVHVDEAGLYCVQTTDYFGNNLLKTLYIADGQVIPFVTENRSEEHIPAETNIITKNK